MRSFRPFWVHRIAELAFADATAAFVTGSVDAWSIWDTYLALAELKENARVIAFDKDVHKPNAFYIARSDFVEKHPALVVRLNSVFASEGQWADTHHEELAKAQGKRLAWTLKRSSALRRSLYLSRRSSR